MRAIYYDEPNCYACPVFESSTVDPCVECVKSRYVPVDILRVGVGLGGHMVTIALPDGRIKNDP